MRIISIGNIDKKFLIFSLIYVIIIVALNILSLAFRKIKLRPGNIPLILIMSHGFLIFFVIFECILKKSMKKKVKEEIINKRNTIDEESEKKLIFNDSNKVDIKNFFILVFMIILELAYDTGLLCYQKVKHDQSELVLGEIYKFMDILFLLILFRCFHKIIFYRHQFISLIVVIVTGFSRFFQVFENFFGEGDDDSVNKNLDYMTLGFIILLPIIDSIKIYVIQKYMKYNFYSPYFICSLIGIIYLIISLVILIIFRNKDCLKDDNICKSLSEIEIDNNILNYILLFLYGFIYASEHFVKFYIMYSFSAFHLILLSSFGEIIDFMYKMILHFEITVLIVDIITYSLEIVAVLVFIETIELNFCNLNVNLKKNIIFRADNEIDNIYKIQKENEDEANSNISEHLNEEEENNDNDNSAYV